MGRMLALLLAALFALPAFAQQPISLFSSHAGNVNFVGTQRTLRQFSNQVDPCTVTDAGTDVTATLSGIPDGATILSAQLYWAGSGKKGDYTVTFENGAVTAPAARRNEVTAESRDFFGAAADVTPIVQAKGNGTYRFGGLSINTKAPYCRVEGVIGGFALLVVYSHPAETFRVLNLYEGFQGIRYGSVPLTLSNFRTPTPLGSATGRIAHITWEGDATLGDTNAEDLLFNSVPMGDALNPQHNQFNSASNINGDSASHGIDFDAYTVGYPIIQEGQESATTLYQSGQDLVLLHAEVVAVPNAPVADLAVGMTLSDDVLTLGQASTYTISATNVGPSAETGPIVISDTFPGELAVNSVGGSGWTCTVSGQLVTCSYDGAVAPGTTLPPITVSATLASLPASGEVTNTVTIAGQSFDNVLANNAATVTAGVAAAGYVFTDAPCVDGQPFGSAAQPCRIYSFGTRVAGTPVGPVYVTALNSRTGEPARQHNSRATTRDIYFGLSCINPSSSAGIVPSFTAQASMSACATGGATPVGGGAAAVTFNAGQPSSNASYTLTYADAGRVSLYMVDTDSNARGSSGDIVFRPAQVVLAQVAQASTGMANPAATTATGPRFVRAGEPFAMTIAAMSSTGSITPNFGREAVPETFTVTLAAANDPATGAAFAEMVVVPDLAGAFGPVVNGSASGSAFSWPEAGILSLTPGIASRNYLGGGDVPGVPVNVGRFYPNHFTTEAQGRIAVCSPNMGCPAGVSAAYAGQPFDVTVTARALAGTALRNYQGAFAREVTLSAWDAAGSTAVPNPPAAPAGASLAGNIVAASAFNDGVATTQTPAYSLPNPFSAAAPRALDWVGPTTVAIRARETADPGVTSLRASGSVEGAVRVLSGRLQVASMYGSELLTMPVPVSAQYWTGGAAGRWENSVNDSASVIVPSAANLAFANCTGPLATNCAGALAPVSAAPFTLAAGAGTVRLAAPGAGRSGSAELRVNSTPWLPSTVGKVVFGLFRTRLDYVREVY